MIPKSRLTTSPSLTIRCTEGMPCTTSSLSEMHMFAGKGGTPFRIWYPLNADLTPFFRISSFASRYSLHYLFTQLCQDFTDDAIGSPHCLDFLSRFEKNHMRTTCS